MDRSEFQEFTTKMGRKDMLLCYSNSLTECRDSRGLTIGVAGLHERVSRLDVHSPATFVGTLLNSLREENSENLLHEDGTIMLCRASSNRVGLKNNLLAPFRLLRRVSDRTQFAN